MRPVVDDGVVSTPCKEKTVKMMDRVVVIMMGSDRSDMGCAAKNMLANMDRCRGE